METRFVQIGQARVQRSTSVCRNSPAAGRGNTFAFTGAPGTSPLPITLGYFSGLPSAQANDPSRYTSTNFASSAFVNTLAPTGPVWTPLSATVTPNLRPEDWEPMETMVEAALALCTGDPRRLTSRIAHSLPLLLELGRPVYTLDGATVYDGWTPDPNDPRMAGAGYLKHH